MAAVQHLSLREKAEANKNLGRELVQDLRLPCSAGTKPLAQSNPGHRPLSHSPAPCQAI